MAPRLRARTAGSTAVIGCSTAARDAAPEAHRDPGHQAQHETVAALAVARPGRRARAAARRHGVGMRAARGRPARRRRCAPRSAIAARRLRPGDRAALRPGRPAARNLPLHAAASARPCAPSAAPCDRAAAPAPAARRRAAAAAPGKWPAKAGRSGVDRLLDRRSRSAAARSSARRAGATRQRLQRELAQRAASSACRWPRAAARRRAPRGAARRPASTLAAQRGDDLRARSASGATTKATSRTTPSGTSSGSQNAPSSTPSMRLRWKFRCASELRLPATWIRSLARPEQPEVLRVDQLQQVGQRRRLAARGRPDTMKRSPSPASARRAAAARRAWSTPRLRWCGAPRPGRPRCSRRSRACGRRGAASACCASCGDSGAVADSTRSTGGSATPDRSSAFRCNGVVTSARGRGSAASASAMSAG